MRPSLKQLLWGIGGIIFLFCTWRIYDFNSREELWGWTPFFWLLGGWAVILGWRQRADRFDLMGWATVAGVGLGSMYNNWVAILGPIVGVAALLILIDKLVERGHRGKQLMWYGFHAMFLYNVVASWWVANTSLAAGVVANALNALFMTLVLLLVFRARQHLPKLGFWVFLPLWIGFEYLHFQWQISWPWLALGHSFAPWPSLAQWFSWTGVFGGSLYILVLGVLLAQLFQIREQGRAVPRSMGIWLLPALGLPLGSIWVMQSSQEDPAVQRVEILAVQPNFEPHYEKFNIPEREQAERFYQLTASALKPGTRLVVFPETSFNQIDEASLESEAFVEWWQEISRGKDSLSLLAGLSTYRRYPENRPLAAMRTQDIGQGRKLYYTAHNTAAGISPGKPIQIYHKSKLVPGVEMFPYRKVLFFFNPLVESLGGTTAGLGVSEEAEVFEMSSGIKAAPLICYESVYGDYVREFVRKGANLLIVPTNDGWWDDSPGHRQHFDLARLRAIETRRWVVQSANSGISGFIDPMGRAFAKTNYAEATVTQYQVGLHQTETPYVQYGDLIGRVMAGSAILVMLSLLNRVIRARQQKSKKA